MAEKYYVVKARAIPEVLLKVAETKRLIESGKIPAVKDAVEVTGISRSSFYKYKDDIFPFDDHSRGKTITMSIQMSDEPGCLSLVLRAIAGFEGNILTIHQSIPVSGLATISLSLNVPVDRDISELVEHLEAMKEITSVKILAGD